MKPVMKQSIAILFPKSWFPWPSISSALKKVGAVFTVFAYSNPPFWIAAGRLNLVDLKYKRRQLLRALIFLERHRLLVWNIAEGIYGHR
jgi:hypothetical protein